MPDVAGAVQRRYGSATRRIALRALALVGIVIAAALTSQTGDWRPIGLVVALGVAALAADAATVTVRRIRFSSGLMVQTSAMALLGPAPAVAIALGSNIVDARLNRVRLEATMNNLALFTFLGLIGGLMFDGLRGALDLDRTDTAYALLVFPAFLVLSAINLGLLLLTHDTLASGAKLRVVRETVMPSLALETVNGILAVVVVLAGAQAGLGVAATLAIVLAVTIPLARTVGDALRRGDDLVELRQVSDARAIEVERLASDRDRLLSEVVDAERRERARLAESLHDGPMQRLMAVRQDALEEHRDTARLDEAIAETRAIITAFHPVAARELGFEAALRAAVAPFPAARSIRLTIQSEVEDRVLTEGLALAIAQELVVNAVKHASPTAIDVVVGETGGRLTLEVNDDGIGIDTEQATRAVRAGHVGLAMVRRRVVDAGGTLDIATRPDGGTRTRVIL